MDPSYDDLDDDFDEEENPDQPPPDGKPPGLRQHTKALERTTKEQARKLAVYEAGLGLNPTQVDAVAAVMKGDPTPDKAREVAEQLGYIEPANQETPPPAAPAPEVTAHERMSQAATGGTPPSQPGNTLETLRKQAETVGPGGLDKIQAAATQAITEAGLNWGALDKADDGRLHPDGADMGEVRL